MPREIHLTRDKFNYCTFIRKKWGKEYLLLFSAVTGNIFSGTGDKNIELLKYRKISQNQRIKDKAGAVHKMV